jgi:hypothetical protein
MAPLPAALGNKQIYIGKSAFSPQNCLDPNTYILAATFLLLCTLQLKLPTCGFACQFFFFFFFLPAFPNDLHGYPAWMSIELVG